MGLADQLARKGRGFIEPVSNPLADRVTELEAELKAALARIAALEEAVTRNAVTPVKHNAPVTRNANAERQRAYRARLKAGKKEQTNA